MEDFFVDNILVSKPKRLNSGGKGKRTERALVKLLNNRFGNGFSRSVGSGNRYSQVSHLPKHAQDTYSGDITALENFAFTIECKGGYDDVDLNAAFIDGITQIDEFLKQVSFDSERCGRKPIVTWKKNRKPWVAIIKTVDLPHLNSVMYMYNTSFFHPSFCPFHMDIISTTYT